jgi:23S rRNA pseudouridine1911/1915/1917 synthase
MSGTVRGWAAELARRTPRQFLHAKGLAFRHPTENRMLEFSSPLPPDLAAAAAWARATSGAA